MDIFKNPTKSAPKSDQQIVRVPMTQADVAGRQDHLPQVGKSPELSIAHVPSAGSSSGSK